jgi:HPr kinase/phosphorylase
MNMATVHATAVARNGDGVLIIGPTGSGKSDLALRLIDRGWRLIADDLVAVVADDGRLIASAPGGTPPRLAVRGIGITGDWPCAAQAPLALVVKLVPDAVSDTLTIGVSDPIQGLRLPQINLFPFENSAVIKLGLALDRWGL